MDTERQDDASDDAGPASEQEQAGADRGADESDDADHSQEADDEADGEQGEPPPDEFEIEHEGKKLKLPKWAEPLVMTRADYTRKTQEAAREREALGERSARVEQAEAFWRDHGKEMAEVVTLDRVIEQLKQVDLTRLSPEEKADVLDRRYRLEQQLTGAKGRLDKAVQERGLAAQEQFRRNGEQAWRECEKLIPKWSEAKRDQVIKHAMALGYSAEQLARLQDPKAYLVLEESRLWREFQAKQQQAARRAEVPAQEPVPRANSGRRSPSDLPRDTDSMEVWARKERKRLASRA